MTLGGKLISTFPILHATLILTSIAYAVINPTWLSAVYIFSAIYVLPVLAFRIHNYFLPVKSGIFDITKPVYNRWWAAHMFQYVFIALPFLETIFHFIPGGFSFWLRCWGSKIGKGIFWTPRVEIVDRNLVEFGDNVVVGHVTAICSHMVVNSDSTLKLFVRKVKIGSGSFIGADSQLGPGAKVNEGELLKPKTRRYWMGQWQ